MIEVPEHIQRFAQFDVYEAIYRTGDRAESILLERRLTAFEEELFFTVIDGQAFRAASIDELVHALPALVSLSILHTVRLIRNDAITKAQLIEIFTPNPSQAHPPHPSQAHPPLVSLQLRMIVDDKTYDTTACDTLMDAIWELQELTEGEPHWRLYTCYHCKYKGLASDYFGGDREYWCYRDVPEILEDIRARRKSSHPNPRYAGMYSANVFHTCAAWQPFQWDAALTPPAPPTAPTA